MTERLQATPESQAMVLATRGRGRPPADKAVADSLHISSVSQHNAASC